MFPIADPRGRVIAFGGRALDANAKAKYLNSPETPLFHKGRGLYNLHRARKPGYDAGTVLVVEGYMDVIGLAQGGFENAVAPLGTALTEDQIQLLWRMAPEPILCFDGDKAGLRAAFRAVERVLPLLKPGHSLRFALLPEGKDPDDLVREEGADAMREVLAKARPLSDMVWEKEVTSGQWDTPERRAALENRIEEVVKSIADPKVRTHYADALRERVRKLFGGVRAAQGTWRGRANPFLPGRARQGRFGPRGSRVEFPGFIAPATAELRRSALAGGGAHGSAREGLLVLAVLNHPELLDAHCEAFSEIEIRTPGLDRLRNEIIDIAALHAPLESDRLKNHLLSRDLADIARTLEGASASKNDRFARPGATPEEAEVGFLAALSRHRRSVTLEAELRSAERMLADEMTEENVARLRSIQAQLELLDRGEGAAG
jgi:DNA primase